ncbi:MAG: CDP-diacylglycerol--serine O-phosphatidyltransferase [Acidobacteriota bacterium]
MTENRLLPPRSWLPNAVTAANITAGFLAMESAASGRFEIAVYLLMLAVLLDSADGRLARLLNATSAFGQQLDSLSDVISFGVAPAFLVYHACLEPLGPLGLVVSLTYLFAGVYRLARFNVLADEHSKASRTMGVPIPIGAGYLMAAALMRDAMSPAASALVVLAMAMLMISRWRLPDLKGKNLVSTMLLIGLFNYVGVLIAPNWYTVGWWNVWNALIVVVARRSDRAADSVDSAGELGDAESTA